MYNNLKKAGKKMMSTQKGGAAKKSMLKDTIRRVKKEQIMDRGPMSQGRNSKFN